MIRKIKLSELSTNVGQIPGLPANPRLINDEKFRKLKKSLQDDPEMLDLRELLVYEYNGKYVIIGGNMRFRAALDLGFESMPCKVIPEGTGVEKLRAYVMKDNIAYGEYDWERLANEWDGKDLDNWGLDIWKEEEGKPSGKDDAANGYSKLEISGDGGDCGLDALKDELESRGYKCNLK